MSLLAKIEALRPQAQAELQGLTSEKEAFDLKVKYLGKKGLLTDLLKELGSLDPALRPQVGQAVNAFKLWFEDTVTESMESLKKSLWAKKLEQEKIDISLPGRDSSLGAFHPVTQVLQEVKTFFLRFGFDVYSGPEIETDYYNFEALAIPPEHPARDMQDTFYLLGPSNLLSQISDAPQAHTTHSSKAGASASPLLLRTHTSPVQVHVMEKMKPPIRMIAPGVVYRKDSDVTHTPMFHQVEGLLVDEGITFADLKGVLTEFLHFIFDSSVKLQFRPSYFPFTEPSAEVDIACVMCKGAGCRICKNTGWLEIMGCGMVDPNVFDYVKYDSEKFTGFAFGMGIERIAMLKWGVNDLRLFFENDVRFLKQF